MLVKLQNHNVHLFEHNSLDSSKDTILIIPGAGMDHRLGQMIDLESLYSKYTVLSIDLPGHGLTSGNWLESIEQMSDLCIDVISKLKINNLIVIGHSMGGLVGIDISSKIKNSLTVLMNTSYPLMVGGGLLDYSKGDLDQASEFLTKYGVYNVPKTEVKSRFFGLMGAGFYAKQKGVINSPYGTKNITENPEREIDLYPLKKIFNQTQKEILSIDLKACGKYVNKNIDQLEGLKFIYGEKDKLARFNPDNEILKNFNEEDIYIMENTGHFPYFERPKDLSNILKGFIPSICT